MVAVVDIVNRALQSIGTRTTVSAAELAAGSSNEAIQASLVIESTRDQLSSMAPWNHCFAAAALAYLGSAPGTPENPITGTGRWSPNDPVPPWLYMYEYPLDCLRALYIIPQPPANNTAATPIFPVNTGVPIAIPRGSPRFRVASAKYIKGGDFGPDFNADFGHNTVQGRVILTNEQAPLLAYSAQITDVTQMDILFHEAWIHVLASKLVLALTGDKALANGEIQRANQIIEQARLADANEEVVVHDPMPDWLRVRGLAAPDPYTAGFNWGGLWPNV